MNILFYGNSLDECLESAESELGIAKEKLNYKITKKAGIFSRTVNIEVKIDSAFGKEKVQETQKKQSDSAKDDLNEKDLLGILDQYESSISVRDGKVIVKESPSCEAKLTITSGKGLELYINNEKCKRGIKYNVTKNDDIRCNVMKTNSVRTFTIRISEDKMKVYGKVLYTPEYFFKLLDQPPTHDLRLKTDKFEGNKPEKYTIQYILEELKKAKVKKGILLNNIKEMCEEGYEEEVLIAEGEEVIDDEPDKIQLFFNSKEVSKLESADDKETIDYKNLKSIPNVESGKIIAKKLPGKIGKDGINIFGEDVKRKIIRNKPIKAGKGCKIANGKVIATVTGRPSVRNGVFTVNNTYSVNNVDIKSGNINFAGDVDVNGIIDEGMKVTCRGSLRVRRDILSSKVKTNGNVEVSKNIINSLVLAGGYDAEKKVYLACLSDFYEELKALVISMDKILVKAPDRRAGELFKILIEQRYKRIPKLSLDILTYNVTLGIKNSELLNFIRNKVIGINAFQIVSINELLEFEDIINDEIECMGEECEIPVDVKAYYVQNSNIVSTGSILIDGPGSYISTLRAFEGIEFTDVDSVVRGGRIIAKQYLKLKNVGSEAGVITELKVDENGVIEADTMHHGTVLYFGNRRKVMNDSGRKVKAYLNKNKEIEVEMLKLDY